MDDDDDDEMGHVSSNTTAFIIDSSPWQQVEMNWMIAKFLPKACQQLFQVNSYNYVSSLALPDCFLLFVFVGAG